MSREHTPVPGKWYENKEEEETFRVLSVDEDDELVEIEYWMAKSKSSISTPGTNWISSSPRSPKAGPTRRKTTMKMRTTTSTMTMMTMMTTMMTTTTMTIDDEEEDDRIS